MTKQTGTVRKHWHLSLTIPTLASSILLIAFSYAQEPNEQPINQVPIIDSFTLILVLVVGIASSVVALVYLQKGSKSTESSESIPREYLASLLGLKNDIENVKQSLEDYVDFKERLTSLEKKLDETDRSFGEMSDIERDEFVQRMRESIEKDAKLDFLEKLKKSLSQRQSVARLTKLTSDQYHRTSDRLNRQLSTLTRRGNLNLSIGIGVAAIGIILLYQTGLNFFYEPFFDQPSVDYWNVASRISLVILIEVFAYFFLRLYSKSLAEIKYFQNEITNLDVKFLTMQVVLCTENDRTIAEVISELSSIERNYILEKGQTTVDLERSKMEKDTIRSIGENFLKAISRVK